MKRLLLLCVVLAACGIREPDFYAFRSTTGGPNSGLTVVVVWLSDSPVDSLDDVLVTITRVELDGVLLAAPATEYNLLQLQNGQRALLGQKSVAPGEYRTLRIHLAASGHRVVNGPATEPLQIQRNVVAIHGPFLLRPGEQLDLQADFNARLSIVEAGGVWRLDPHITLVDPREAAFIAGRVTDAAGQPLASATVSAQLGSREVASTRSDGDGSFRIEALPPSAYTVVATAAGHAPAIEFAVRTGTTDNRLALTRASQEDLAGTAPFGALTAQLELNGVFIALAGVAPQTGTFLFPAVPAGSYTLRFLGFAGSLQALPVTVGP